MSLTSTVPPMTLAALVVPTDGVAIDTALEIIIVVVVIVEIIVTLTVSFTMEYVVDSTKWPIVSDCHTDVIDSVMLVIIQFL